MTTIDSLFELGIELRDNGVLKDSVNVFLKILDNYPDHEKISGVYSVLGGVYKDLEENEDALTCFKKASDLNPKSELASLGLYITYAELDRDEEAIKELIRYLRQFPADLYKDTLEELLEGLEQGYMTDFKDEINELAKINGVELRDT